MAGFSSTRGFEVEGSEDACLGVERDGGGLDGRTWKVLRWADCFGAVLRGRRKRGMLAIDMMVTCLVCPLSQLRS